jgi:hypothetical protein
MDGKTCPKCNKFKEKTMFSKSTARKDRMAVYCKLCENAERKKRSDEKKRDSMFGII